MHFTSKAEKDTRLNRINHILENNGWTIINYDKQLNTSELVSHAVQEYPLVTGIADYALFIDGFLLGIVEAKKLSINSQSALEQAKRYSKGASQGISNWRGYRVPFLYSSNGELIYFLDIRQESNLSRQIKTFHTPSGLRELLTRDYSKAYEWLRNNLVINNERLRPYQIEAIAAIEKVIIKGKRDLLLAMATGTGKTFTIVSSIYRLLASKTVKRVLFLVDRSALAAQAVRAFASFATPNGNKFDQEYEVYSQAFQKEDFGEEEKFNSKVLPNNYLTEPTDNHTFVYVSTIQRMKLNLFGNSSSQEIEDTQDVEDEGSVEQLNIPIHAFDLIISDECHRGYTAKEDGYWRRVLEHFDAIRIGLTATPAVHTLSLFHEVVFRYTTEEAIADGYLVDYEQVNINSDVTINGTFLRQGEIVTRVDRQTGAKFYDQLEDERQFNSTDIESKITLPDRNRKIIEEIAKYAYQHEAETGRFPKILIFASNDLEHTSHANQVVTICKEVFARGDDFVQKITGKVDRPLQKIREFRNRPNPAIAVTVDLLTTGVDIPGIEFVVFMRQVKSRILWVQMLGRGTRLCHDINKTHFKIFDCFGGSLVEYFADTTDFKIDPPRQQAMTISQVISNIIYEVELEHYLQMLNRRLHRIDRGIDSSAREQLEFYLPHANNRGFAQSFQDLWEGQPKKAISLLQNEQFIDFLDNYPRVQTTFLIAEEVEDRVSSEVVVQGQKPEDYLDSFNRFIQENSEQIEALQILRQRPQDWSVEALEQLREKLKENRFSETNLQRAYQLVHHKALVDIISLIRSVFNHSDSVYTASERVERAIALVSEGKNFTPEQWEWLGYIKQHLIQNLSIDLDDFEYAPIFELHGGKGKAQKVFGDEFNSLISSLNSAIAA
jgi:type I restriction enzyme R subunit